MMRAMAWGLWLLFVGVFTLDTAHELEHALSDHHADSCDLCAWDWAVVSEWEPAPEVPAFTEFLAGTLRSLSGNDRIVPQRRSRRDGARAPPWG